jgi:hypothetical protein
MESKSSPQTILKQIAQIDFMERGKLCVLREGPNGPYFNLQCWQEGKNCSRYVPRRQVPELQQALDGYDRFEQLVEDYCQQIFEKTRAQIALGSKKKKPSRRKSF